MAVSKISSDAGVGRKWKYYASATALDLTTVSGKGTACARRIVFLAAGSATLLKDSGGNDEPITSFPEGYVHDADTSAITCATAFVVYW